jgi:DNA (cytosine-5)-methyltransferase 1
MAAVDAWGIALKTFKHNHPESLVYNGDIRTIPPSKVMADLGMKRGDLDVIIGGPPCQGFSKNVVAANRFLGDERNQLFNEYLHYVEAFFPKVLVMENVAEIYNAYDGVVRTEIVERLEKMGYEVDVKVMFAPEYGVPQRRRRCIFFGSRTGIAPTFPDATHGEDDVQTLFEAKKQYVSAWNAISDLPLLQNGEGEEVMAYTDPVTNDFQKFMRKDSKDLYNHKTRELKGTQLERVQALEAGQGIKDLPDHLRPKGGYSGAYGRLDFKKVAPTITRWVFHPGSGRYCHPREARLLTTREAARLQSFTDDFHFLGTFIEKAHQIGNAVPSLLMYSMAPNIIKCVATAKQGAQSPRKKVVVLN